MDDFYFEEEPQQTESSIDIKRYINAIVKKWWLWMGLTVLIAGPWLMYVKNEKPIYEAQAVIQFKSYEGVDWGLLESRIQKLTSRTFAEKVVQELGLVMEMEPLEEDVPLSRKEIFRHFSASRRPVTGTYAIRFTQDGFILYRLLDEEGQKREKVYAGKIAEAQKDTVSVNGFEFLLAADDQAFPEEVRFHIKNFRKTVKDFQQRIRVDYQPPGTLMTIKLQDTDPFLAALMTNRLAEIYVRESISLKGEKTRAQLQILKAQLDQAEKELAISNRELADFRRRNAVDLDAAATRQNTDLANAEQKKQTLEEEKKTIRLLLDEAQKLLSGTGAEDEQQLSLEKRLFFKDFVRLELFKDNPKMLVLKSRLEDLDARYEKAASLSTVNPEALKLAAELDALHQEIYQTAEGEIRKIDQEIRKLNAKIRSLEAKLARLPAKQMEYAELTRKNEKLVAIYQETLAKYQQAQLSAVAETEEIKILDPAIEPDRPVNSNKKIKAIAGVFGALMFGLGVVLLTEALNKSIKTPHDIKKHLRLNVLGTIPRVDFEDVFDFQDSEKLKMIDQQLVTHDYSPTPIGEAYRSLRTSIMFSKNVGRIQTLVITSMEPGDGKSFTSANLAITFAQQKSNTLLVDTDLRRGVLHNTFGVPKEPGFSNYLTSSIPIAELINETHIPNLSLLSCGSLIPNPSELLGSHQMKRFLDEVRRRFDIIIFDTPPLNAATDAVVIGTQVDATIIVVRAGKTNRDTAKQKLELYEHVPAKVIGVVLNGTTPDLAHEGYSYYHY